jgi:hypothetical protein
MLILHEISVAMSRGLTSRLCFAQQTFNRQSIRLLYPLLGLVRRPKQGAGLAQRVSLLETLRLFLKEPQSLKGEILRYPDSGGSCATSLATP